MSEEDDEQYRNTNFCRFCEKEIFCDKVRDRCHLKKYRGPTHDKCNFIVTPNQKNFLPFAFHILYFSIVI